MKGSCRRHEFVIARVGSLRAVCDVGRRILVGLEHLDVEARAAACCKVDVGLNGGVHLVGVVSGEGAPIRAKRRVALRSRPKRYVVIVRDLAELWVVGEIEALARGHVERDASEKDFGCLGFQK